MAAVRSRAALRAALFCLPLLAGCTPPQAPPNGWATLPNDAVVGAGDPVRGAIINTAYVFGNPGSVAGQPDQAARAVANYAFLTVELPYGPRWRGFNPTIGIELGFGMQEVQAAFGIAPNAPTQAVVDGLYGASRALRAGDTAAAERILSPPVFTLGGAATVQRLAAMPVLPRAAAGANLAMQEMDRQDRLGSPRGGGAGGGGGGGGGRP
ncbi:hypothetical protein ACFQS7_00580 [Dankookia sp. GCM10030260]|uniref:hypothetical protein n=1 Tax=Dankookia sp. GCM10030260 TaxID=3273390 RepID=UPI00361DE17A